MAANKGVFTKAAYQDTRRSATGGGKKTATHAAEDRQQSGKGLDPLADPKGLPHLGHGPIRLSLPRFEPHPSGLWELKCDMPMLLEGLLDTTGSMGDNVNTAFDVLPDLYDLLASGSRPVLGKYDTHIINACFGDVEDQGTPILCRTQAEMDVKIAQQLAMMVPSRNGCSNGKEDPQFGIFAAAYLTKARINAYGLRRYHFTVSDEPVFETLNLDWLKTIFGEDVIKWVNQNGFEMEANKLPDVAQVVTDLKTQAHAFFLQVGQRTDVNTQWCRLYGSQNVVVLPSGTTHLHHVQALIIGLTEGGLDLESAIQFLREHGVDNYPAKQIVGAVSHIPIGAQTLLPNFGKLPQIGDLFKEKTDLWPAEKKTEGKLSKAKVKWV